MLSIKSVAQALRRSVPIIRACLPVVLPLYIATADQDDKQRIDDLERQLEDLRRFMEFILWPIAILLAILALGGALGVVFSIRDQRRVSQLHELAVGSEVSSQRRTEQSYSTFLEESQKTLTLVNDTLELAKEATDRATHTMERKASASLASLEQSARDLLEPILDSDQFDSVLDAPRTRADIETLAGELRAIEGYLLLQDIELKPYIRFVKGMAEYLDDNTEAALRTLRGAAQDSSSRKLQQFSIYWAAYFHVALGQYQLASNVFRDGEAALPVGGLEYVEFESMAESAEFYTLAQETSTDDPASRLVRVSGLLTQLRRLDKQTDHVSRTSDELAEIRAQVYQWVAYERADLTRPIALHVLAAADDVDFTPLNQAMHAKGRSELSRVANALDGAVLRVWAYQEAARIYGAQNETKKTGLMLAFGKAECAFRLRQLETEVGADQHVSQLEATFSALERTASDQLGSGHEGHRRSIELATVALVCACRRLEGSRGAARASEAELLADVRAKERRVRELLGELREHHITLFSHLQGRPLRQEAFSDEITRLFEQAITPKAEPGGQDD